MPQQDRPLSAERAARDWASRVTSGAGLSDGRKIGVVHLARAANGTEPLRSFLDSYRSHSAGIDHDLIIVLKGFQPPLSSEYEQILNGLRHERRFMPDRGLDLDIYFHIARTTHQDVLCFLNSHSVILAHGWLANLHRALLQDGVGLVGATGSCGSLRGYENPVSSVRRPAWKRSLLRWFPWLKTVARIVRSGRDRRWRAFDPFPNCHVRTNSFMLRRETALRVHFRPTRTKFDAWLVESGRHGLTRQILEMGRRSLVVDRDGRTYEVDRWYESNTFWRLNQEKLMVADNQSRAYEVADAEERERLSIFAWGPHANPGSPNP